MSGYIAPSSDYRFLAEHVLAHEYSQTPGAADADAATLSEIVATLGTFVSECLVPLSVSADEEGCTVAEGVVRTPKGYREAYKELTTAGWASLHVLQDHGGQGLPLAVGLACDEVLSSGSMSFALYASLRLGVYKVIDSLGSDALKSDYLHRIGSGEWNGTMCLTEPQCGTDLSLLRTTASDQGDGTYRVSGTKIFITGGDHDLTENIAHLVLARVQGGAPGLAGLGLFIVPKIRKDSSGAWTVSNGVRCSRVENKLGIHASATAELLFEEAHGWLVGQPGAGLAGMFIMMKLARLGTSFQAIGVAEIASQKALAYAKERIQGRDLVGGRKGSVSIIDHPNIRRELVRMRTLTSSARVLAFFASLIQECTESPDRALAVQSEHLLSMLMPISKVIASEYGVEVATAAMQTLGGHGYIRESGIEVLLRDVQILPIYEGTNDVQSLDIVLRRLGEGCPQLLAWMHAQVAAMPLAAHAGQVLKTLSLIETAATSLALQLKSSPFAALQMAREFLWLVGHGVMGVLWLRTLQAIDQGGDLQIDERSKRAEADFYFAFIHPEVDVRATRLAAATEVQSALLAHSLDYI